MLLSEALWIKKAIMVANDSFTLDHRNNGIRLLNIGSSTLHFREVVQPHIAREVIEPAVAIGMNVINIDLKDGVGVDLTLDLTTEEGSRSLLELRPGIVLCSNVLEHLDDQARFVGVLNSLASVGTCLIITVPKSFPYHPDPIDNRFRPTLLELEALFPDYISVKSEEVFGPTYLEDLLSNPKRIPRWFLRTLSPYPNIDGWLSAVDRLKWIARPYSAACVLLMPRSRI